MGSNLAHNSVENISKLSLSHSSFILDNNTNAQLLTSLASLLEVSNDGSDRICSIAFVSNFAPAFTNKVNETLRYTLTSNLAVAYHMETRWKQSSPMKPRSETSYLQIWAEKINP